MVEVNENYNLLRFQGGSSIFKVVHLFQGGGGGGQIAYFL